ncbi:hypothetical protein CEXT_732221 [Caerostris extrusa]|uniref:Uncharacterized protein n=1 Tax=Caerostris extrusa TaxID=172846 RepID=A0AAV4Y482_CAEEX|nr:hypothetical protein CEXT_732221 [Caerostris extrusa]
METIPCPDFFSKKLNLFKVMWNCPKFMFPSFLCLNLIQIMYLFSFPLAKDQWAGLIVLSCNCGSTSAFSIRTKNPAADGRPLQNIEHAACSHSPEEDVEDLHLAVLFIRDFGTAFFDATFFSSGVVHDELRNSKIIPALLKEPFVHVLNVNDAFTILLAKLFFCNIAWILLLCM